MIDIFNILNLLQFLVFSSLHNFKPNIIVWITGLVVSLLNICILEEI